MKDQANQLRVLMQQSKQRVQKVNIDSQKHFEEVREIEAVELKSMISSKTDVETLLELEEPMNEAKDVKVIAVCSGKGGVGKSNFTMNLALAEQQAGRQALVIDIDFGFTNIDVLCGVTPQYTLQDVMNGEKTIEEVIVEGPLGLKFIPGGKDALSAANATKSHQEFLRQQLTKLTDVDTILIDTGAGINKSLMLYAMFAQEIVVVTTTEPTSFTDAYHFIKVIDKYRIKKNIKVVVNRVFNEEDGFKTFELLEVTTKRYLNLTLEYIGSIRDDKVVSQSVKTQTPFMVKYPNSHPSSDLRKIRKILFESNVTQGKVRSIQQVMDRFLKVFS